jgi:hypothetical protein
MIRRDVEPIDVPSVFWVGVPFFDRGDADLAIRKPTTLILMIRATENSGRCIPIPSFGGPLMTSFRRVGVAMFAFLLSSLAPGRNGPFADRLRCVVVHPAE